MSQSPKFDTLVSASALPKLLERDDVILFDFPGAASKIRMISGCATIHASYWVGYSALSVSGLATFNTKLMYALPEAAPTALETLPAYMSVSSPMWSAVGLGFSALFLAMSHVNANCVVRRIALVDDDGRAAQRQKKLAVSSHTLFGGMKEPVILEPWNVVEGGSVVAINDTPTMITFKPAGNSFATFHRVIDTENAELKENKKGALLRALESCHANTASGGGDQSHSNARKSKRQRNRGGK